MNIVKIKNAFIVDGQIVYQDEKGEVKFPVSYDSKPNVVYKSKEEIELDSKLKFKLSNNHMDTVITSINNPALWDK